MCYHNSLSKNGEELKNRYNAEFERSEEFNPIFHASGFSYPAWPVITASEPNLIQLYNWGLIPHWAKEKEKALGDRMYTLNAKSETVFNLPSFKFSIKQKRCLVPSTGFYEWMDYNKKKYPHMIRLRDIEVFSMAGIYSTWTDTTSGEVFNTFSILTAPANPLMERIHNIKKRMPVLLNPETEREWLKLELSAQEYENIFTPFDEDKMTFHTISKLITSRSENPNVPKVQLPFDYPELQLN